MAYYVSFFFLWYIRQLLVVPVVYLCKLHSGRISVLFFCICICILRRMEWNEEEIAIEKKTEKKKKKGEGEQDINIEDNTSVQFSLLLSSTKEAEDIILFSVFASTDKHFRQSTSVCKYRV